MEELSKLKTEDQEFYTYLSLNASRSNNAISPEDNARLLEIASKEPGAKELEELYKKVVEKQATIEDYTSKYEKYKSELEQSVRDSLTKKPEETAPKKELSKESKGMIEYFNLEIKRVNTPLTDAEKEKVENLRTSIQKVRTLEAAHNKVNSKQIPTQVLKSLREKYKKTIKDEIQALCLNEKDYLPDDTVIYKELEEIDKKEVPKEVTKSSLNDIKQVFDIKKKATEEPQEAKKDNDLYDDIASNGSKKEEVTDSSIQRLKDENDILREKIDLYKTKIEFLEEQIAELRSRSNDSQKEEGIPKAFVELAKYYKLDLKRERNEITDEELEELRNLTRGTNPMIDEIEDVVRMKANGELSIKEYKEKHDEVYNKNKVKLEEVVKEYKARKK